MIFYDGSADGASGVQGTNVIKSGALENGVECEVWTNIHDIGKFDHRSEMHVRCKRKNISQCFKYENAHTPLKAEREFL